jgi:hypothetical protein
VFATETVARTTKTAGRASDFTRKTKRDLEIVPVLLIDLTTVSETMKPLVDNLLLIKKLESE